MTGSPDFTESITVLPFSTCQHTRHLHVFFSRSLFASNTTHTETRDDERDQRPSNLFDDIFFCTNLFLNYTEGGGEG